MLTQMAFLGRSVAICYRCGRQLSNPLSVQLEIGPVCRGHNRRDIGQKEDKTVSDICKRSKFSDHEYTAIPFTKEIVLERFERQVDFPSSAEVGGVITNVPHLVIHHSPDGYEFGYAGSGPADLALNICQMYLNITGYEGEKCKCYDGKCFNLAWSLHQEFKRAFIANAPRTGTRIPFGVIDAWFKQNIPEKLL